MMRGVRHGLMLLATGAIVTGAAAAQTPARLPAGAVVQPIEPDAGAELRRNLTLLADNPRSLDALIGAGRAALGAGDAEAALSFFGRADQVSPRNARVKAGMASAFVLLRRAQSALSLFAEAVSLGAPEVEIAGDRGLAFDMVGDPRRAQRDYAMALRHRDDPEVRRRMALSLAISGERDAALRMIDPQLRSHDRAAWRVQAFVLALTGDAAGASRTAQGMMPPAAAQAMAPFLARLPTLSPAEKAMAVHFGLFPSDGIARSAPAQANVPADPDAVTLAMGGPQPVVQPGGDAASQRSGASRRRPEAGASRTRRETRRSGRTRRAETVADAPERQPAPVAQLNTRWAGAPAESRSQPQPSVAQPPAESAAPPQSGVPSSAQSAQTRIASAQPDQPLARAPPQSAPAPSPSPGFSLAPQGPQPAPDQPSGSSPALADIAAIVQSLPQEPARRPAAPPPSSEPVRTAQTRSEPPASQRPSGRRAAQPAHPSRHWVQIAGGADRSALPREFARLRAQAPAELGRRTAWTTPLRATNRLLVGPFASPREAQQFVNRLAERNVSAFAWTSPAGQEIERLQTR